MMPKHKPMVMTGNDLHHQLFCEAGPWSNGWEEREIAEKLGVPFDEDTDRLDDDCIIDFWWRVEWPEHVTVAQFDADATYHGPFCTEEEARR